MVLVDAAEEQVVFSHLPLLRQAGAMQRVGGALADFGLARPLVALMVAQNQAAGHLPPGVTAADLDEAVALTARRSFWRTSLDEGAAYDATPAAERVPGGFGALGDRPLVVIRHGQPFAGYNAPMAAMEDGWAESQARLAALSTDSRLIVATRNGHDIAMENPALVADAVRAVVVAVRTGKRLG
jgi:pimeloyl-ACP methyl ester carboxylesterase